MRRVSISRKELHGKMEVFNDHPSDIIAVNALKAVASEMYLPYKTVKKKFAVDHDRNVTIRFWMQIEKQGFSFSRVYCCPGCGKFDLE